MTKKCNTCTRILPLNEFCKNRSRKDGLCNQCRECQGQRAKNYRKRNRGRLIQYQKEYSTTEHGREVQRKNQQKHRATLVGHLGQVFSDMNQRCNNPDRKDYKYYGGRGIQNRFESLDGFRDYVTNVLKIDPRGLQIDRINNDGHYERGNIRFVTAKVNMGNQRNMVKKTFCL